MARTPKHKDVEMDNPELADSIKIAAMPYKQAVKNLTRMRRKWNLLATDRRTGGHLREVIGQIDLAIDTARSTLIAYTPARTCDFCSGAGCHKCNDTGFWIAGKMRPNEKQGN